MYSTIMTGAVHGITSYLLRVETNISSGLPSFHMVGFMSAEMREAGERVRVALKNAGISSPSARITVNLAPADIPKRGIVIDLPVAVGELICMELLRQEDFENVLVAGELGLNGEIRPVRGNLQTRLRKLDEGQFDALVLMIELSLLDEGTKVVIEVKDNGKGIRKKDVKNVFTPGFTTKKRGWGLGLSLAKRIVEEYHKGRIFVKSSEVGFGTTFRIEMPK